ncbi:hypothetical protein LguiB_032721 [Lonicera macranthoides]
MRMEQILLGEFVNIVRRLKKSILFVGRWDIVTMNDEPSEKIDKIQDVILQFDRYIMCSDIIDKPFYLGRQKPISNLEALRYNMDEHLIIELHHGGKFVRKPILYYSGGKLKYCYNVDKDLVSYFELKGMVTELGYKNLSKI